MSIEFLTDNPDSYTIPAGPNDVYARAGNDTIIGNDDSNKIGLGEGNDLAHGGGGADIIWGKAGNDVIFGDAGDDILFHGVGDDLVYGGDGNDMVFGGAGVNPSGSDKIFGGAGSDTAYAGDMNDTVDGGTGSDEIGGGKGDDILFANESDTVFGGDGFDTAYLEGVANQYLFDIDLEGVIHLTDLGTGGGGTGTIQVNGVEQVITGDSAVISLDIDLTQLIGQLEEIPIVGDLLLDVLGDLGLAGLLDELGLPGIGLEDLIDGLGLDDLGLGTGGTLDDLLDDAGILDDILGGIIDLPGLPDLPI